MTKIRNKVDIEGTHLNITKDIYDKSIASIMLNNEKSKPFL